MMIVLPEPASSTIIGQMPRLSSGVLEVLGAIRSPGAFSESVGGFLFESHWMYWVVCLGAAGAFFFAGQSRQNPRFTKIALALAGLTVLWIVTAGAFVTPRERLRKAHEDLAAAAKAGDVDRILTHLSKDFQCTAMGITLLVPGARDQIGGYLKNYGVGTSYITAYEPEISGPSAHTRLTLLTETNHGTVKTSWVITWEDMGEQNSAWDWQVSIADLKTVGDQAISPGQIIP